MTSSSPLSSSFLCRSATSRAAGRNPAPATRVHFRRQIRVSASSAAAGSGSLYEVLGIQTGATCQEVKAAYRRLARVVHPDVASGCSAGHEFMRVHEAYATLSDPQKRADYDSALTVRRRRVGQQFSSTSPVSVSAAGRSSGAAGFSSFPRRRWESDQCW